MSAPQPANGGWVTPEATAEASDSVRVPAGSPLDTDMGLEGAGVAVARGDATWPGTATVSAAEDDGPLGQLAPVGVLGVLDGGFDLLRWGFGPLVGLAAALLLPLQLVDLLLQLRSGLEPEVVAGASPMVTLAGIGDSAAGYTWVILALRVVVLSFLGLAAGAMVADLLTRRRRTGPRLAIAAGGRWWVAVLLPVLCVPVKVMGGCLAYVGFFVVDALLMCASVVAGAEGGGPLRAFARSWRLGWRAIGTATGISIGGFLIVTILQVSLYLGPVALAAIFVSSDAWLAVVQQVSQLVLLVTQPLTACIAARAYVELRCRGEALDLDRRRHDLGLVP